MFSTNYLFDLPQDMLNLIFKKSINSYFKSYKPKTYYYINNPHNAGVKNLEYIIVNNGVNSYYFDPTKN
jgi:hypothetical protein